MWMPTQYKTRHSRPIFARGWPFDRTRCHWAAAYTMSPRHLQAPLGLLWTEAFRNLSPQIRMLFVLLHISQVMHRRTVWTPNAWMWMMSSCQRPWVEVCDKMTSTRSGSQTSAQATLSIWECGSSSTNVALGSRCSVDETGTAYHVFDGALNFHKSRERAERENGRTKMANGSSGRDG